MRTAVQGQAPLGPSLRELVSRGPHGVGDADLVLATGITALDISDNPNITTVAPFARTLRKLMARGSHCRIRDRNLVRKIVRKGSHFFLFFAGYFYIYYDSLLY
jgi:hypothetical protein